MATIIANPNNCPGTDQRTLEYTSPTGAYIIQLRHRRSGTTSYYWTRIIVQRANTNGLITPSLTLTHSKHPEVIETVSGTGWSTGNNNTYGSVFCSKAIGIVDGSLRPNRASISNGAGNFDKITVSGIAI